MNDVIVELIRQVGAVTVTLAPLVWAIYRLWRRTAALRAAGLTAARKILDRERKDLYARRQIAPPAEAQELRRLEASINEVRDLIWEAQGGQPGTRREQDNDDFARLLKS